MLFRSSQEYAKVLSELSQDSARNRLIAKDVAAAAGNGAGTCLVLSDRKAHCETIKSLLDSHGVASEMLTGDIANGKRQEIIARLNRGQIKVLISTTQLLSEGFDAKCLETLFLITPITWHGRLTQCVGRCLRPAPGKTKAAVFDYVDAHVPVLAASARARRRVYADG